MSRSFRILSRMTPVLVAALLAGCVVGPDYAPPGIGLPAKWSGADQKTGALSVASWWRAMKDPVLDGILETAMAQSLDLEAAKAKIREARASYRETAGTAFPGIGADASTGRMKTAPSGALSSAFQTGMDASWELDLFGGLKRSREAARYSADAAAEDLRAARVTLAADVVTNYVNARGYQARIALARKTAASQRQTLELTRSKKEAGAASELDVVNAQGQVAATEANIPELETALATAVHRLGVLSGGEPTALAETMRKRKAIPGLPRLPSAGIPAEVMAHRPDVQAAAHRLASATSGIGIARAARLPSVSLTGAISTSAASVGDLMKSSTIGWQIGPSVSVPLFNGGRLAAAEDVAVAKKDEALIAYRQSVSNALEEVENSLVSIRNDRQKVAKLSQSAAAYGRAAEMTRSSYDLGAVSFFDVVATERSHYSAEDSLISSRVALTLGYVSLNKALGGGWEAEEARAGAAKTR
ncbi:Cation efflux system protein CusC precursor [compost metagenome]